MAVNKVLGRAHITLLYGHRFALLPHQRVEDDDPTLGGESQLQHRAKLQTLLQHFRS